jgi:hypothetical protein
VTLVILLERMPTRRLYRDQYRTCKEFLTDLAQSTTLVSIKFGDWGRQEKEFDIFLLEKRRILWEQNSTSFAEPLRHLSIPGYPNWTVLLDVLRILHHKDSKSQIQTI